MGLQRQIRSKKVSHEVINYIGNSLKLCQETERHIILSQGKKNYILQSNLAGQTAHRSKVYGDYVTSQNKGTLMALQGDKTSNRVLYFLKDRSIALLCH